MASETITRNDLTAILNSVLPNPADMTPQEVEDFVDSLLGQGGSYTLAFEQISLPFTPQQNGILYTLIRANVQGRAYIIFNNTTPTLVDGYNVAQGYFSGIVFVNKGQTVTQNTTSNVASAEYHFVTVAVESNGGN